MRWRGRERSSNVEDRRGRRPTKMAVGGGGLGLLLLIGVAMFMGADPKAILQLIGEPQQQPVGEVQAIPGQAPDDDVREFIEVVLRDTEEVWTRMFLEQVRGGEYQQPRLILFSGAVQTGCGPADSAVGPFYCPADQRVYIDPSFFEDLKRRHQAPGDFAQAYVIAHEVAHHVQNLLGISDSVSKVRQGGNKIETNRASVRLELQADFLAGVWAHHAHKESAL